ncbi:MAG TPA: shikimate kinase [Bacteroidales bacterium]|nr:shikimate kinase [Bacteroidales bacterium]
MRIFLIGFMGSGKTTAGKKLAKKAGFSFLDMDKEIEKKHNLKVGQIFEERGEEIFRQFERDMLHEITVKDDMVVSTGGGVPCYYDNMEFMNNNGITVYLRLDPSSLVKRLEEAKTDRPLIKDRNHQQLIEYVTSKLAEREEYYNQASHVIDARNLKISTLLELLR